MAKANPKTIDALKIMLAKQLEVEHEWYNLKHQISDTDLKGSPTRYPSARIDFKLWWTVFQTDPLPTPA